MRQSNTPNTVGTYKAGSSMLSLIAAMLPIAAPAPQAHAACDPQELAKLVASDGATNDNFGVSVAISGDTAVVGAYHDEHDGSPGSGAAYVFIRSGAVWTQQAKLTASDAGWYDYFGQSVAVFADTAVIGAPADDNSAGGDAGSAYVFVRSGEVWTEQAKLTASDGRLGDSFGTSLAVFGDTVVVGVPGADFPGRPDSGSANVFVRSAGVWTWQAKLTASDGTAGDLFGYSVALFGDTALIGAYADGAGSAYVFIRSAGVWTQQAKLTASDASGGDRFGFSVAISGDTAVIGTPWDWVGGSYAGSAYVFVRSGASWTQQAKLTASDHAAYDEFGRSVSAAGDVAVIGAGGHDPAGSAYLFGRSAGAWTEQAELTASDGALSDFFGISVAASRETALIGADLDDHAGGTDAGSAYVFDLHCAIALGDLNCDGLINSQDIDGFIYALSGEADAYNAYLHSFPEYHSCDMLRADFTGDGSVNNQDIDGFIEALFG